jgi:hypothetical protein
MSDPIQPSADAVPTEAEQTELQSRVVEGVQQESGPAGSTAAGNEVAPTWAGYPLTWGDEG